MKIYLHCLEYGYHSLLHRPRKKLTCHSFIVLLCIKKAVLKPPSKQKIALSVPKDLKYFHDNRHLTLQEPSHLPWRSQRHHCVLALFPNNNRHYRSVTNRIKLLQCLLMNVSRLTMISNFRTIDYLPKLM